MILATEISKVAHSLGLGERTIEKDYVLTWILFAIADLPMRDRLAFKGGTAIKKVYAPDYRFSEDLDFTLLDPQITNEELRIGIEALFPWLEREANLRLAIREVDIHAGGNPTFCLNYVGPLQAGLGSRFLKVDISRDENIIFPTEKRPLRALYTDCQNRKFLIETYSPEEILAEKLRSLLTRTEPRDLYDIHYMLTNQMADVGKMVFSMGPKFEAKGLMVGNLRTILTRRRAIFNKLWTKRLQGQMPEIPSLEKVIRETNRFIQNNL